MLARVERIKYNRRMPFFFLFLISVCRAEIVEFPGAKTIPHEPYVRTVPETDSPVEQVYIKSKDGLYVAAAVRRPKGSGPFPALIHFHGAPGGRGMEQLVGWARGNHGSPVFERFLKDGFVVVISDYRGGQNLRRLGEQPPPEQVTYVDDALAVFEHVRKLPYVMPNEISVYGVSLGGDVVSHLISRTEVRAAILGAPAPFRFLGVTGLGESGPDRFRNMRIDEEVAQQRIASIRTPVLILVGTADSLLAINRPYHDLLQKSGKKVRMEIYKDGYHDFVIGPQGQNRSEPLLDITLHALESTLQFVRNPDRRLTEPRP